MKFESIILAILLFTISCEGHSQNRIQVIIPSAKMESAYIWQTIQDIKFIEENKYQINLPKDEFIEELKLKSKQNTLNDNDYIKLETFMTDSLYDKADYLKGYIKIKNQSSVINKMINQIDQLKLNWTFKTFKTYQINITLYGPGGSYNPDEGSILIFTTPDGQFKNYNNPTNTIIHEITHVGIENSIINRYQVPHVLKERIVDTFVFLNFEEALPDYKIQDMGDYRINQYIKTKDDLMNLSAHTEDLIKKAIESSETQTDSLKLYLGQKPPSTTPEIFAPNIISIDGKYEFGSVFNKDVTEFFYGLVVNRKEHIGYSKLIGNKWSAPKLISVEDQYGRNDPFLSPDENRLYFISQRPLDGVGEAKDYDIWYVERIDNEWSDPINAGSNINSDEDEYYMSFTNDGTMYFSSNKVGDNFDIYSSKIIDGEFQEAIPLSDAINTPAYEADVFIDPDETYIIFCATRKEGLGRGDLYISFKNTDGTWSKSVNMGNNINTTNHELCPFVSKDGKYLFYTSNQDIYWVSTKILDNYRE